MVMISGIVNVIRASMSFAEKILVIFAVLAISCESVAGGKQESTGVTTNDDHHYGAHYHRSNRILEGDIGDLRCVKLISDVKWTETTMTAKLPPDVDGTWVSQSCEVRPGPEFLLRKYLFGANQSFGLQQFYYADDKCTTPSHVVLAEGSYQLTSPSWLVPGGMDTDYMLSRVQVLAYDEDVAEALALKANVSCSRSVGKLPWTTRHFYSIYRYVDDGDAAEGIGEFDIVSNDIDIAEDVDCLDAFGLVFHELQLMRVEYRRSRRLIEQKKFWKGRKVELLLGTVNLDTEKRHYRPTSYQQPLAKVDQVDVSCAVCRMVSKATPMFPPVHVSTRVMPLPVRLSGEWLSTRCETRTNSMFLTRRLLFYEDHHSSWKGFYDYFVDAKCQSSVFSLVASGRVELGNASQIIASATEVDFIVEYVKVTTHSAAMVNNLNALSLGTCGKKGKWALGVPQEISATGGCVGLGLQVPSREREIVKMELDHSGNAWMFLGTDFQKETAADFDIQDENLADKQRPTSYQWPLLQCQEYLMTFDYDQSNSLSSVYDDDGGGGGIKSSRFQTALESGTSELCCTHFLVLSISFIYWCSLMSL